jgi:rRNA maturation RNase YbeY
VRDNAKALGNPFYQELHRVIFHGLLHLMGYKDKQASDQKKMRKAEDALLSKYFG